MGIKRRTFLQMLGVSGATVALSPSSAITLDRNLYINSRLGFSLEKPEAWHFASIRDFQKGTDTMVRLGKDEVLTRELIDFVGTPVLVITKHFPDDVLETFTPNIQIYADPITSASPKAFIEELESGKYFLSKYYDN
ncbi:MAG: twin-arginine translocation signal domain-containing protein [Neptuniibacter sp.]